MKQTALSKVNEPYSIILSLSGTKRLTFQWVKEFLKVWALGYWLFFLPLYSNWNISSFGVSNPLGFGLKLYHQYFRLSDLQIEPEAEQLLSWTSICLINPAYMRFTNLHYHTSWFLIINLFHSQSLSLDFSLTLVLAESLIPSLSPSVSLSYQFCFSRELWLKQILPTVVLEE